MSRSGSGSSRDYHPPQPPAYSRNSRQDSARYVENDEYYDSKPSNRPPRSKWEDAADRATGGSDRPFQRNEEALYDEDEDLETLQIRTKDLQAESLQSTRRAMTRIKETEFIGQSNLTKVANQGGMH